MSATRRNIIVGGIAWLVIVVGVLALVRYKAVRSPDDPSATDPYTSYGICLACERESQATVYTNPPPPLRCPHCNEVAVYQWRFCLNCAHKVIPDPVVSTEDGISWRYAPLPLCPFCEERLNEPWYPGVAEQYGIEQISVYPPPDWPLKPPQTFTPPDTYRFVGVCVHCGHDFTDTRATEDQPPLVCPICGERAAHAWRYCQDCGTRFIPQLRWEVGQPAPMPVAMPRCPSCDSNNVTLYTPEQHGEPGEDAPLPDWPRAPSSNPRPAPMPSNPY